jgi:ribose-phosphate pyrophosphokinase
MDSANGTATSQPVLVAGSGSRHLVTAIEDDLGREPGLSFGACSTERFPDGEVSVQLDESVRGRHVILLAATSPPVNDRLVELLAMADACRRANAAHIVAIMPYFGYARSDRRDGRRTPIMARLAAEMLEASGVGHVIVLDVHSPALEGFFRVTVDHLSAVPLLSRTLAASVTGDAVLVAPDQGAVRLTNRYATLLGLPVAICHKLRLGGAEVRVNRVVGDVRDRRCIIVDDMISTGGTIAECARAVQEAGAHADIMVAATHAVFAPGARERIAEAGVSRLFVTDSIAVSLGGSTATDHATSGVRLDTEVVSVAPLLANVIRHLLDGGSLREFNRG